MCLGIISKDFTTNNMKKTKTNIKTTKKDRIKWIRVRFFFYYYHNIIDSNIVILSIFINI